MNKEHWGSWNWVRNCGPKYTYPYISSRSHLTLHLIFLIGMSITERKSEVGPSIIQVQPKERMQLCAALRSFCKVPQDSWIPFMTVTFHQYRATDFWKFLNSVKWQSNICNNWEVILSENFYHLKMIPGFWRSLWGARRNLFPPSKRKN